MIFKLLSYLYRHVLIKPRKINDFVHASPTVRGLSNVNFLGNNLVPEFCNFSGKIKIGVNTTLGVHNFLHGEIEIGKYCQVGAYVAIHTNNHPITHLTSYINKNLFDTELAENVSKGTIRIGHDVWIGHNAMLVGSFRVGNGAIIAAGAVVTSDVPAYSIVAGIPAKVIRYRFPENIITEIEDLQWWDKNDAELKSIKPLFLKDLSQLESLYN
jgi:virginiamycin A acetyltransferase